MPPPPITSRSCIMKFDLLDVMTNMKKEFGDKGEVLLTQAVTGVTIRLRVFIKEELYSNEFTIGHDEMMSDNYVWISNFEFHKAVSQLKQYVEEHG